jgi:hypothetical protein
MKTILFALWIGLTAGLVWLADFTNGQNRELIREVRALQEQNEHMRRILGESLLNSHDFVCQPASPSIRELNPEVPNGSN